jgi:riboflavin biosynthesis pyrimidine reductase
VRQLLPVPAEVDLEEALTDERTGPEGRPWVLSLMVATADGAAWVGGRTGHLGGATDRAVFLAVRALADVIVVGAGTVRTERYGPVRTPAEHLEARVLRGQAPHPRLVVVSGRLDIPDDLRLLTEEDGAGPRPVVVHPPGVDADARRRLDGRVELWEVPAGPLGGVDVTALLAAVGATGAAVAVVEGGPSLNGHLVAADVLDEMSLTLDPRIVGGDAARIVAGAGEGILRPWRTAALLEEDGTLVWRLLRDRG